MFPKQFGKHLAQRKPLGLIGFVIIIWHSVYSFVELFGWSIAKMLYENPKAAGMYSAVIALLIFIAMAVTSNKVSVKNMGYVKWKALQTFGYVGLLLAVMHFIILETKPNIGLDVRPYGLLFLLIPLVALIVRFGMIFIKVPKRKKFEEHFGE